jgi:hypothetical protein
MPSSAVSVWAGTVAAEDDIPPKPVQRSPEHTANSTEGYRGMPLPRGNY